MDRKLDFRMEEIKFVHCNPVHPSAGKFNAIYNLKKIR